jgi:magnesium transporter
MAHTQLSFVELTSSGDYALVELERQDVLQLVHDFASNFGFHNCNLRPRDLRVVDADFEPMFLVRTLCILVRLPPVRCIIVPDRVLLLVGPGADADLLKFRSRLEGVEKGAFELRALETVMWLCSSSLQKQVGAADVLVRRSTQGDNSFELLESLRELRTVVNRLKAQAVSCREALRAVLRQDADMALMSLSSMLANHALYQGPEEAWVERHSEVEMLFEAYVQSLTSTIDRIDFIKRDMDSTESGAKHKMILKRNRLIQVETLMRSVNGACGFGSLIAAIFGMNLNSSVQQLDALFWIVAGTTLGIVVIIFLGSVLVITEV